MSPASNLAAIFITAVILLVALYAVFIADRKTNRAADIRHAEWLRRHQAHVAPRWEQERNALARRLPEPTPMRWTQRIRRDSGQALAEMALALPVLLFIGLGFIEAGFLLGTRDEQARNTGVVADYAAAHPDNNSWESVANRVLPGCEVEDESDPGHDVRTFRATCQYNPVATHGLWDGLPISTEANAATTNPPMSAPAPTP